MTTTDELREAVAEEIRFYGRRKVSYMPTHNAGRAAADRIIRLVVERCASEANDAWLDGEPAKRIQTRIRALVHKEPSP